MRPPDDELGERGRQKAMKLEMLAELKAAGMLTDPFTRVVWDQENLSSICVLPDQEMQMEEAREHGSKRGFAEPVSGIFLNYLGHGHPERTPNWYRGKILRAVLAFERAYSKGWMESAIRYSRYAERYFTAYRPHASVSGQGRIEFIVRQLTAPPRNEGPRVYTLRALAILSPSRLPDDPYSENTKRLLENIVRENFNLQYKFSLTRDTLRRAVKEIKELLG